MAGITFLLERHIKKPFLSQSLLIEAVDSFEAIGPWFLTIFSLAVMGLTVHALTGRSPLTFYLMVTYATAVSLIISSPFHTLYTRHLADEIYLSRFRAILNGLTALSVLVVAVSLGISSGLVFFISSIKINLKIAFIGLTTLLSLLWCISSILSSLKREKLLFFLFLGGVISNLALFAVFRPTGTHILILLFSLGIAVPLAGGYAFILKLYLRGEIAADWSFLKRPGSLPLGLSLFFFNLAFWADKFLFWFMPETAQGSDPLFHYFADYDYPFFIALTIMMIGLLLVYKGIKRRITGPYESFIFKLRHNFPFPELALEKTRLVHGISQISSSIFIFYGGISLLILFLVYLGAVVPPWKNPFVFHFLLVGTIFFALYFFYLLVLQYLDDFRALLKLNLVFLIMNVCGTYLTIRVGWKAYGIGFMLAAMICSFIGFHMVNRRIGGLEYEVFRKALMQEKADGAKS